MRAVVTGELACVAMEATTGGRGTPTRQIWGVVLVGNLHNADQLLQQRSLVHEVRSDDAPFSHLARGRIGVRSCALGARRIRRAANEYPKEDRRRAGVGRLGICEVGGGDRVPVSSCL